MGGRMGLKGTDGVVNEALAAGAEQVAGPRAKIIAKTFLDLSKRDESLRVRWLTCGGAVGADRLRAADVGENTIAVVQPPRGRTTAAQTSKAVEACVQRSAALPPA